MGGKLHLKQNIGLGTIVNKYHEGIVKRTLKRELEVPELVGNKANDMSAVMRGCDVQVSINWCICMSIEVCILHRVCLALQVES